MNEFIEGARFLLKLVGFGITLHYFAYAIAWGVAKGWAKVEHKTTNYYTTPVPIKKPPEQEFMDSKLNDLIEQSKLVSVPIVGTLDTETGEIKQKSDKPQ